MLFNSFIFIFFLGVVLLVYYLTPKKFSNYVLLLSSYVFYSYFDYRFSILLLGITLLTFFVANQIVLTKDHKRKKTFLISGVIINLLVLGILKYYNFFLNSIIPIFSEIGINADALHIKLILPIGISFYVFQALSLIIDAYLHEESKPYNFISVSVFLSFFPTVMAGPIERANRVIPQLEKEKRFTKDNFSKGFALISIGYLRKVLIGDAAGKIADQIFTSPEYYLSTELIFGVLLFTIQIYNDFAGYSMIAKGAAKLLGIDIMDNFNQPYLSSSVTDFWRRWHISLSTWLRDYLFTPLQIVFRNHKVWGNVIALLITFSLCGLWHGANWNFIFWGFLHGFYMSFSLLTQRKRDSIIKSIGLFSPGFLNGCKILFTFTLITFSWIFFRANNMDAAFYIINKILLFEMGEFTTRFLIITLSYYSISFFLDYMEILFNDKALPVLKIATQFRYGVLLAFWLILLIYMFQATPLPFIYFQF